MKAVGDEAEQLAATFLKRQGLKLLAQNYQCPFGEIDLICEDQGVLVFVEVRLRQNEMFGGARFSITPTKQLRLSRSAHHYLQQHKHNQPPCRFDVILLKELELNSVEWIKDAFSVQAG